MVKQNNNMTWIIIVAIIAVVYFLFAGNPFATTTTTTNDVTPVVGTCGVPEVTFHPLMTRMGKAGTAINTAADNYFIITDTIGSVAADSTALVATNKNLAVIFGENSTAYYSVYKDDINTGCESPFTYPVQLPLADASLNSFYIENSDGTVNSASAVEDMAADDVFETTVTIKAGTNEYFGNPTSNCQNVAVVQYDKTYFKSATGDNPVAVPGSFTYNNATYDGSNAFYIPKTANGEKATFNLRLESTSVAPTSSTVPVKITLYDCNIDKNEDNLQIIEGVEDEDLNSISLVPQTKDLFIQ